jgi:hypothetical protein
MGYLRRIIDCDTTASIVGMEIEGKYGHRQTPG